MAESSLVRCYNVVVNSTPSSSYRPRISITTSQDLSGRKAGAITWAQAPFRHYSCILFATDSEKMVRITLSDGSWWWRFRTGWTKLRHEEIYSCQATSVALGVRFVLLELEQLLLGLQLAFCLGSQCSSDRSSIEKTPENNVLYWCTTTMRSCLWMKQEHRGRWCLLH